MPRGKQGFQKGNKLGCRNKGRKCLWKNKVSEGVKKLWQDKNYRERNIKATLKGLRKRPTTLEKLLIEIIEKHNLSYKFVGDGSFLLGYKNPDFIEVNGKKICIEVGYDFYKIRDYGSRENYQLERSNHFRKYGWNTIFLWGNRELEKSEKEIVSILN